MNRDTTIKLPGKMKRIIRTVKFISSAVLVGMAVYKMIPKSEKISGIDEGGFTANRNV